MSLYDWKQSSALEVPGSHKDTMVEIITPAPTIHPFPTWNGSHLFCHIESWRSNIMISTNQRSVSWWIWTNENAPPQPLQPTMICLTARTGWIFLVASRVLSVLCVLQIKLRDRTFTIISKIMILLWSSRLVRQLCRLRYELVLSFSFNQDIDLMNF